MKPPNRLMEIALRNLLICVGITLFITYTAHAEDQKLKTTESTQRIEFPNENALRNDPNIFESLNPKSSSSGVVIHHSLINAPSQSSGNSKDRKGMMMEMLTKSGVSLSKEDIKDLSSFIQDYNKLKSGKAGLTVKEQRVKMLESIFTEGSRANQTGTKIQSDSGNSIPAIGFNNATLQNNAQERINGLRSSKNQSFTGNALEGSLDGNNSPAFPGDTQKSLDSRSLLSFTRGNTITRNSPNRKSNLIQTTEDTALGIHSSRRKRFDQRRRRFDSLLRRNLENAESGSLEQLDNPLANTIQDPGLKPINALSELSNQTSPIRSAGNGIQGALTTPQNGPLNFLSQDRQRSGLGRLPNSRILARKNLGPKINPGSTPVEMHSSGMPRIRLRTYPTSFDLPRRK